MFCAAHERKLRDAAASGEPLSVELRQHVRTCAGCAAEWEEEQALLAMVDGNLREAVNAKVPGSLIAGVRTRVAELEPRTIWWKPALVFAATVVVAAIGVRAIYMNSGPRVVPEQNAVVATAVGSAGHGSDAGRSTPGTLASLQKLPTQNALAARETKHEIGNARRSAEPQILASPAEMAGLQQYMRHLQAKTIQATALEQAKEEAKNEEPFAIRDVEFAEIDLGVVTIAPLDGAK